MIRMMTTMMMSMYHEHDNINDLGDGDLPPQQEHNGSVTASPTNSSFSILTVKPVQPPGPNLTAEIELMNILRKHKVPLNLYKEIYRWATTSQNRMGFDFSSSRPVRARKTTFKDISDRLNLPLEKFESYVINWLPGNIPTALSIRCFKNALNSLLSNTYFTREDNFSFPDASTPYSPVSLDNGPDDETIISELHHGD